MVTCRPRALSTALGILIRQRGVLFDERRWLGLVVFDTAQNPPSLLFPLRGFSASSAGSDGRTGASTTDDEFNQSWATLPGPPKIPLSDGIPHRQAEPARLWGGPPCVERRVYCNRSLNMASISAIGFDMDYTLAQYNSEAFESLVYKLTLEKLVSVFHYPKNLLADLSFGYNCHYMIRGLLVDKERGNVLKADRHRYVKVAYHGFRELSSKERQATYNRTSVRDAMQESSNYRVIDTLFSLAEAYLFMQLVELKDKHPDTMPSTKTYFDMATDIRRSVDLCHRDGSLKQEVAARPHEYIHRDPALVPLLKQLREAGHKLFLATNSFWDYTHVVMKFLVADDQDAGGNPDAYNWLQHFDAVFTGCGKPRFFTEQRPLFEVNLATGMLQNTDGGTPMVPIGEDALPLKQEEHFTPTGDKGNAARVFQGGTFKDLHRLFSIQSGTEVLYAGDHIYGDIVISKKEAGWRTMFIVPELENELRILKGQADVQKELVALRRQRAVIEDQIECLEWQLQHGHDNIDGGHGPSKAMVQQLQELVSSLNDDHHLLLRSFHRDHHKVWGQHLKAGYQNSQFAYQIDKHACLYTSHIANMMFYSPMKHFRGRCDRMPHEEELMLETSPGEDCQSMTDIASCLDPPP